MTAQRIFISLAAMLVMALLFRVVFRTNAQMEEQQVVGTVERGIQSMVIHDAFPDQTNDSSKVDVEATAGSESTDDCALGKPDCQYDALSIARKASDAHMEHVYAVAIMNDPSTGSLDEVSEHERLMTYAQFDEEPVDASWSAGKINQIYTGVQQAAGIGRDIAPDFVDCRTSTCMIRFITQTDEDEIDLLQKISVLIGTAGLTAKNRVYRSDQYVDVYMSDIKTVRVW